MYPSTFVREAQPDWLTVGAHTRANVERLGDLARALQQTEQADGNRPRPFRLLGYEGWQCGRVRHGEARGWGLLQLSGDAANTWLHSALACADSVSRLDLAVTVQTDRPDPDLGRRAYQDAASWRLTHPKAAKPWFVGGQDVGWTTYIGQRESDTYCRIYDKAAETRDTGDPALIAQYENCWRVEVEYKAAAAQAVSGRILDTDNIHSTSLSLVHRYLSDRGIRAPFDCDAVIAPIGTLRRRSDREGKLQWLSGQVAPTVRWLMDHGDTSAAMMALGLGDYLRADGASALATKSTG